MCTGGGVAAGDLAHRVGDRGQPVYARPTLPRGLSGEVAGYRSRFANRAGAAREGRYDARAKRPSQRPQRLVAEWKVDRLLSGEPPPGIATHEHGLKWAG